MNSSDKLGIFHRKHSIVLALKVGKNTVLITNLNERDHDTIGWFYDNGYYYYGTKTESGNTKTIDLAQIGAYGGQDWSRTNSYGVSDRRAHRLRYLSKLEGRVGFEPTITELQSIALPLGYPPKRKTPTNVSLVSL